MNESALISAATLARKRAYAPYSHFPVGAALLTASGAIYGGCNVENISFGLTLCAERCAAMAAVAADDRTFEVIAIVADTDLPLSPCGACRQVLAEFTPNLRIVSATLQGKSEVFMLSDLLPRAKTGILNAP